MNMRDLRYFQAIARSGSLAAATQRLNITQPALTKCIDRLEAHFQAPLFTRNGRHIEPTPMGRVLEQWAGKILQGLDDAFQEISDHSGGRAGHVRIGVAATITETLMPQVISRMARDAPAITLELTVGMGDVLRAALRDDRLDLLVSPIEENDEFLCEAVRRDEVVVVASRAHPLAGRHVAPEELAGYLWILPPPSVALRIWLEAQVAALGLPRPRVQVEVNSLVQMPKLIAGTTFLSFVSRRMLDRDREYGNLAQIAVPELVYRRTFGIITRRSGYVSSAARTFVACMKAVCAED